MTPAKFAKAVLLAQDIREKSWDKARERYNHDFDYSAKLACEECKLDTAWAYPIGLLNLTTWNDIQMWAEEQR